jgi:hypothetical protein
MSNGAYYATNLAIAAVLWTVILSAVALCVAGLLMAVGKHDA